MQKYRNFRHGAFVRTRLSRSVHEYWFSYLLYLKELKILYPMVYNTCYNTEDGSVGAKWSILTSLGFGGGYFSSLS